MSCIGAVLRRRRRAPGLGGREAVEPLGVPPQELVLDLGREMADPLLDDADAVRPRRVGVRVVRLAHDVVLADLVDARDPVRVVDEAAEDVVAEERADVDRVQVHVGRGVLHELHAALHPEPLLVEDLLGPLQEVGHPADLPFRQRDLQVGELGEHAAEEPRQHGPRGAHGAPGEVGHERGVGGDLGDLRRRADVHAAHHLEVGCGGHHRVPVAVGVVDRREPERRRVLGEGEGGGALGGAALHLLGGQRRVPHRDEDQGDVTARRRGAPLLDHPVVVGLQAHEAEVPVARLHEELPAEARDRREAQRSEDPGAVHVLDARLRVVTAGAHLGVGHRLGAELLLLLAGHGAEPRARVALAVVDPELHVALDHLVGRPVAVLRRHAVDPEVRWLQDVVVHRDEPVQRQFGRHCPSSFEFSAAVRRSPCA